MRRLERRDAGRDCLDNDCSSRAAPARHDGGAATIRASEALFLQDGDAPLYNGGEFVGWFYNGQRCA